MFATQPPQFTTQPRVDRPALRVAGLIALGAASALMALAGLRTNPLAAVPLVLVLAALALPRGSGVRTALIATATAVVGAAVLLLGFAAVLLLLFLAATGGGHLG